MHRTIMDIWRGQPGVANHCMNAVCIKRNKKLFPHPVLGVSVVKSRVYVFDAVDHVVRYALSAKDSKLIEMHDKASLGEPGDLTLHVPQKIEKRVGGHDKTGGGGHSSTGKNKKGLSKGEQGRILAAVGAE
jgi:hypothetical protein